MNADEAAAILERRSRDLARPLAAPAPLEARDLITIAIGDELCGVESRAVREIFRPKEIVPLPGAEPPVFGLAIWRGDLLTVLDIRSNRTLQSDPQRSRQVIVLGVDDRTAGLVIDEARDLVPLALDRLHPATGLAAERDYFAGISGTGILVLDARRFLQSHA